jgi:hypothetical protein
MSSTDIVNNDNLYTRVVYTQGEAPEVVFGTVLHNDMNDEGRFHVLWDDGSSSYETSADVLSWKSAYHNYQSEDIFLTYGAYESFVRSFAAGDEFFNYWILSANLGLPQGHRVDAKMLKGYKISIIENDDDGNKTADIADIIYTRAVQNKMHKRCDLHEYKIQRHSNGKTEWMKWEELQRGLQNFNYYWKSYCDKDKEEEDNDSSNTEGQEEEDDNGKQTNVDVEARLESFQKMIVELQQQNQELVAKTKNLEEELGKKPAPATVTPTSAATAAQRRTGVPISFLSAHTKAATCSSGTRMATRTTRGMEQTRPKRESHPALFRAAKQQRVQRESVKKEEFPTDFVSSFLGRNPPAGMLFTPTSQRRRDVWQVVKLIGHPGGPTPTHAWCTICNVPLKYNNRDPKCVTRHVEKLHPEHAYMSKQSEVQKLKAQNIQLQEMNVRMQQAATAHHPPALSVPSPSVGQFGHSAPSFPGPSASQFAQHQPQPYVQPFYTAQPHPLAPPQQFTQTQQSQQSPTLPQGPTHGPYFHGF